MALLIAQGIHGGEIAEKQDTQQSSGFLYRVQVGAFSVKANADRILKELQSKGFDAFVTTVDMGQILYRVQVGAFSVKANAEAMRNKLSTAGYEAIIVQA